MSTRPWKREILDRWGREAQTASLKGSLGMEEILRLQVMHCLLAGKEDPDRYEDNVLKLLNMIPDSWKDDEFRRDEEVFIKVENTPVFRYCCGTPMGTIDKPVKDRGGRVISPIFKDMEIVDSDKILSACINLFDRRQLLMPKIYKDYVPGDIIEDYPVEEDVP